MAVIASMHLRIEIVQLEITCKAFSFLWAKEIHLILILICFATYRLEYGQFPQYSPPVGMTPELGYHPAHVFPAAALHVAAEQKRNDFLAAMNKQNLMQKESVSPKNADEAEKNEEAIKTTKIDGLGVSGELLVRITTQGLVHTERKRRRKRKVWKQNEKFQRKFSLSLLLSLFVNGF